METRLDNHPHFFVCNDCKIHSYLQDEITTHCKENNHTWSEQEFQWQEGVCNWCGNKEIDRIDHAFGCDLDHDIYKCKKCKKLTWEHIHWSQCEKLPNGGYRGL